MPDISLDFSRTWACWLLFLSAYSIQSWLTFLSSPHYLLIAVDSMNSVLALLLEILSASCCHGSHRYCCGYWCFLLLLPLFYSSSSFCHEASLTPDSTFSNLQVLNVTVMAERSFRSSWIDTVMAERLPDPLELTLSCELDTNYNVLWMWNVIRDFPG